MLKVKCAYYIKLFAIIALAVVLLGLVESAPQYPVHFLLTAVAIIYFIRKLWISVLKDERTLKKRTRVRFSPKNPKGYDHEKAA